MATYKETPHKICEICKIDFKRKPRCGFKVWDNTRFCSLQCRGKQKFSPETTQKKLIGLAPYLSNRKGSKPWNWMEDRSKLKLGDRSFHDPQYKQWHKAVKNRDGWKCKISNSDCSGRLEAHHILPWSSHPKLRYEVNNGIALCHFHHPRKRVDEIKLSPFFQSLVASQE